MSWQVVLSWDVSYGSGIEAAVGVCCVKSICCVVNLLSDIIVLILQHCYLECHSAGLGSESSILLYFGTKGNIVFEFKGSVD
jgi:hypothetical protein